MSAVLHLLRTYSTRSQLKPIFELCRRSRGSLSKRSLERGFSGRSERNDATETELKRSNDSVYSRIKAAKKKTAFSVDRSTLIGGWQDDDAGDDNEDKVGEHKVNPRRKTKLLSHKEPLTPLAKDLQYYIKMRGPITIHDYVGQTSNHSLHGYYQQKISQPVIGEAGDFITSPEISQLFGEMIGVWLISAWKSLGSPPHIRLVELGPGKGTLMNDILRVAVRFPAFFDALSVHMVEMSDSMRALQKQSLGCKPRTDLVAAEAEAKVTTTAHVDDRSASSVCGTSLSSTGEGAFDEQPLQTAGGVPITWYKMFSRIPSPEIAHSEPLLLVAQEFLDALPVHQFVYTAKGWREKLVDVDESTKVDDKLHFRSVLARSATPATRAFFGNGLAGSSSGDRGNGGSGTTTTTTTTTNNNNNSSNSSGSSSALLQRKIEADVNALRRDVGLGTGSDVSRICRADNRKENAATAAAEQQLSVGDEIEISPLALATVEDIAKQLAVCGGAGLIIDYGEMFTQGDSLRGFKRHQQVSIYSEPGLVDITADVDFAACAKHAVGQGAKVYGAVPQGEFLLRMGIVERLQQLIELPTTTDEQATKMLAAFRRIVGSDSADGMGKRFKVMAITDPNVRVDGFE